MDLARYYFITDDLDDLETLEDKLLAEGISVSQTHVLSRRNSEVNSHDNLNSVSSFMKRDLVHSTILGFVAGAFAASLLLIASYILNWNESSAGWLPFILLALMVLFFFTWMGGFWGIQIPNHHFRRFQKVLDQGEHVFFVDIADNDREKMMQIVRDHPKLRFAGIGEPMPSWLVSVEKFTEHWWYWRMWRNA